MGRLLTVAAGVGLVILLVIAVRDAMRSDEEIVRDRLVGMLDAFNDRELSAVSGLSRDWHDTTAGVDRATLRAGLVYWYQRFASSGAAGGFGLRAELVPDTFTFAIGTDDDGEPNAADVTFELRLHDATADEPWHVRVAADYQLTRSAGWVARRSRHETLAGRRPSAR